MTDDDTPSQAEEQPPIPNPDVDDLDRLVGSWDVSGGTEGAITYEWMDGESFLIQRVDLEQHGQSITGIEIIGHEREFGTEPGEEIRSRFYDSTGNTLGYVYEMDGDTLTIWGEEKDSPAYFQGEFSDDDDTLTGEWVYPDGGGYESTMARVE